MKKLALIWSIIFFVTSPVIANEKKFDGFYAGVALSKSYARDHGKEFESDGSQYYAQKNQPRGNSFSINSGYNKVFNDFYVAGIDISLEKNDVNDTVLQENSGVPDACCAVDSKVKESVYFGGKVGAIISENTLLYISAGKSVKHIKRSYFDYSLPETHIDQLWQRGWYKGFGVEQYISKNYSILADYKRINLGERSYEGFTIWGTQKHNYKENNFRVGVNYYF